MPDPVTDNATKQSDSGNDSDSDNFTTPYVEQLEPLQSEVNYYQGSKGPQTPVELVTHPRKSLDRRLRRYSSDAVLDSRARIAKSMNGTITLNRARVADRPTEQQGGVESGHNDSLERDIHRLPFPNSLNKTEMAYQPRYHDPMRKEGNVSPLKPCMKQKSRSAAATPPIDRSGDQYDINQGQQLRRVKTVDFEDTLSKPLLAVPPLQVWEDGAKGQQALHIDRSQDQQGNRPVGVFQGERYSTPSFINPKSEPADTAVTKTDVHVVAIAPSWSAEELSNEEGPVPATPTMQIVESNNGTYQVIWSDISREHEESRTKRRSSSASQALQSATWLPLRGLERVNTKLTEWSWSSRSPADAFKPQIVVFPDDDGRTPIFNGAVEEDGDGITIAPPNSLRTSASASRYASQATSVRPSRSPSHDDDNEKPMFVEDPRSQEEITAKQEGLVVPNPEASPRRAGSRIGASQGMKRLSGDRRLSNVEESEMKFRGHRDSVTLARSRILHAGGVSPELFLHHDSVALVKKRMHEKNHTASTVRERPHLNATASERLPKVDDTHEGPLSPERKQDGVEGLKNNSLTSMLAQEPNDVHRHIRIVE